METKDLSCLVASNCLCFLTLKKIDDISERPEIDLENEVWVNRSGQRVKIGEYQSCHGEKLDIDIRFVFDHKNWNHIRTALDVTANFHR
jgi:hypothetical protein